MEKGCPQRFWIIEYTSLRICCHCYSLGYVNEIIKVNEGPWRKATPKGSGSLPTPRSGFAATVIPWDTVLCNVKYKWNTDSCGSYLHVIMTLRPTALHSFPYGQILSFSLSRPASSMVGVWQLLFTSFPASFCLLLFHDFQFEYSLCTCNEIPIQLDYNNGCRLCGYESIPSAEITMPVSCIMTRGIADSRVTLCGEWL